MLTAGIDVGTQSTKVVLLHQAHFSTVVLRNGAQPAGLAAWKALELAVQETNRNLDDINTIIATMATVKITQG